MIGNEFPTNHITARRVTWRETKRWPARVHQRFQRNSLELSSRWVFVLFFLMERIKANVCAVAHWLRCCVLRGGSVAVINRGCKGPEDMSSLLIRWVLFRYNHTSQLFLSYDKLLLHQNFCLQTRWRNWIFSKLQMCDVDKHNGQVTARQAVASRVDLTDLTWHICQSFTVLKITFLKI